MSDYAGMSDALEPCPDCGSSKHKSCGVQMSDYADKYAAEAWLKERGYKILGLPLHYERSIGDGRVAVGYKYPDEVLAEYVRAAEPEIRRQVLEDACKALCWKCKLEWTVERGLNYEGELAHFVHVEARHSETGAVLSATTCEAERVRALIDAPPTEAGEKR